MTTNPWIGKLVVPKNSFRRPTPNEYGMVINILPKANGGFNCSLIHRDGTESSMPPSGLDEVPPRMRGKLQWQILEVLGKKLAAAQHQYDIASTLMRAAA